MNITIDIDNEVHEIKLYGFQAWGQRFFCYGDVKGIKTEFISSTHFTDLFMQSEHGMLHRFSGTKKYSPYSCKVDISDIRYSSDSAYRESVRAIGPKEFSGNYIHVKKLELYIDNVYFETIEFEKPDFDLYEYQNDEAYRFSCHSKNRDTLPKLYGKYDIPLFGKLNIIHGIVKIGEGYFEDFFDCFSLNEMLSMDMGIIDKSALNALGRFVNNAPCSYMNFFMKFCNSDFLNKLLKDGGNGYIRKHLLRDRTVRKYNFRHIYEYNKIIQSLTRKIDYKKPPEYENKVWKYKLILHGVGSNNSNCYEFVLYQNMESTYRNQTNTRLNEVIVNLDNPLIANAILKISAYYDFNNMSVKFNDFTKKDLIKTLEDKGFFSVSIPLKRYLARLDQFSSSDGSKPKIFWVDVTRVKGSKIDQIRTYVIKDQPFYINLFDFFTVFCQHHPLISDSLKIGSVSKQFLIEDIRIKHEFDVYYSAKDAISKPTKIITDYNLNQSMILLDDAIYILKEIENLENRTRSQYLLFIESGILETRTDNKDNPARRSQVWYRNVNKLSMLASPPLEEIPVFDGDFLTFDSLEEI